MAFYTYRCDCQPEPFEIQAKPSEIPLKNCPHCNKENPERVYSSTVYGSFPDGGAYKSASYWNNKK